MSTCPTCRQEIPLEPGVVRVTPETVQDLRDVWQADHHGLITQRILFVTVTKEATDETKNQNDRPGIDRSGCTAGLLDVVHPIVDRCPGLPKVKTA